MITDGSHVQFAVEVVRQGIVVRCTVCLCCLPVVVCHVGTALSSRQGCLQGHQGGVVGSLSGRQQGLGGLNGAVLLLKGSKEGGEARNMQGVKKRRDYAQVFSPIGEPMRHILAAGSRDWAISMVLFF